MFCALISNTCNFNILTLGWTSLHNTTDGPMHPQFSLELFLPYSNEIYHLFTILGRALEWPRGIKHFLQESKGFIKCWALFFIVGYLITHKLLGKNLAWPFPMDALKRFLFKFSEDFFSSTLKNSSRLPRYSIKYPNLHNWCYQ